MEILIVSPPASLVNGNTNTAASWATELAALGHSVRVKPSYDGRSAELLIALHATKSHEALVQFQTAHPEASTVVVLAGTDLYPDLSATSLHSLAIADRIVVLQAKALHRLPTNLQQKTEVIPLSAPPPPAPADQSELCPADLFKVCVVGHLRGVKDPLRTAHAARLLPESSKIVVLHVGAILEERFEAEVEREQKENPRYRWLGALEYDAAYQLIASSDLFVLSSIAEGGGRVLSEAILANTPILAARNDASTSLLGDDYPGLFETGATAELAALMEHCENDAAFLDQL